MRMIKPGEANQLKLAFGTRKYELNILDMKCAVRDEARDILTG